jgi:hypothetical protein
MSPPYVSVMSGRWWKKEKGVIIQSSLPVTATHLPSRRCGKRTPGKEIARAGWEKKRSRPLG